MFRIWFDRKSGMFIVQVLRFGIWWQDVCREISGDGGVLAMQRQFHTYTDADQWVERIGLRNALKESRFTVSWWTHVVYGGN